MSAAFLYPVLSVTPSALKPSRRAPRLTDVASLIEEMKRLYPIEPDKLPPASVASDRAMLKAVILERLKKTR